MSPVSPSKQQQQRTEIAVACLDRLAALVATWRPNGDGFLIVDDREAWERTALEAEAAVDLVLDGLHAGTLRDAAETCRRRVEEVLAPEPLIHANTPERIHKARTALGIAGEVLRPSWARIPLKYAAEVIGTDRRDNLLRRCRLQGVKIARCRGAVYADAHGLAGAGILTAEQVADFYLRFPSDHTQFASRPAEVAASG